MSDKDEKKHDKILEKWTDIDLVYYDVGKALNMFEEPFWENGKIIIYNDENSFNPEKTVPPEQIKKVWNRFFKVKNIKIAFLIHERVLDSSFACCICGAPSSDKNKLCDHLRE